MNTATRLIALTSLTMLLPFLASASTLYMDPKSGTYGPGDTFIVNVRLNTDDTQCLNAAQVNIEYPTSVLRAVDFSRGNSIFSLWISDPKIDTDAGSITFAGGVPGGYCGRIPGDPALSNIIGTIVFSVVSSSSKSAVVHFAPGTSVYKNDGLGTALVPTLSVATITIAPIAQLTSNPWIDEVKSDIAPPEPFTVQAESQRDVFDGKYFIVFSTVDKQSGVDHYEIAQGASWVHIASPYVLKDQSLKNIEVRAIDKAGNIRIGTYASSSVPVRQYSFNDFVPPLIALVFFGLIALLMHYIHRHTHRRDVIDLRS